MRPLESGEAHYLHPPRPQLSMQHQTRRATEGPRATGRPRVQHPGPFALVAEQAVSMAIDDRSGLGIVTAQALVPLAGREHTVAVHHDQGPARQLQRRLEGKLQEAVTLILGPLRWCVVVTAHRHHRSCRPKRSEHARSADVAGMDGAVALAHHLRHACIEHAMRIGEDGYAHDQTCAPTIGAIRDFRAEMCPLWLDQNTLLVTNFSAMLGKRQRVAHIKIHLGRVRSALTTFEDPTIFSRDFARVVPTYNVSQ